MKRKTLTLESAALAAMMAVHVLFLSAWLKKDTRPPAWDESHHLLIALEYRDAFAKGDWTRPLRPVYSNYPPLHHLALGVALGSSGEPEARIDRAVALNVFYHALLIVSLWWIGRRIGGPGAGLAAAAVGSFSPALLWLMHRPMLDLALAAWTCAAFAALDRTRDFSSRTWSAILGAVCAAGMLTKWSFAAYVALPVAWRLCAAWRRGEKLGPLLFAGVASAVALPWYVPNAIPSLLRMMKLSGLKEARDPGAASWAGWTWYVRGVAGHQLLWPAAAAALGGIAVFVRKREGALLTWLLVPLVLFTAIQNKDLRYFAPAIPAAAVAAACAPLLWRGVRTRRVLWCLLSLWAAATGAGYSFADAWPAAARSALASAGLTPLRPLSHEVFFQTDSPQAGDWKTGEIASALQELGRERPARVALLSNHPHLHPWTLKLSLALQGGSGVHVFAPKKNLGQMTDAVLVKSGDLGPAFTLGYVAEAADIVRSSAPWFHQAFRKTSEWHLPDGSDAALYVLDPRGQGGFPAVGDIEVRLETFPFPRFEAEGLRLALSPSRNPKAPAGLFDRVTLSCDRLNYRGLVLRDVDVELKDALVSLPRLADGELLLLRLGAVRPRARLPAEDAAAYLSKRAKLQNVGVRFDDAIELEGEWKGIPVRLKADLSVSPDAPEIVFRLLSVRFAGVAIPLQPLTAWTVRRYSLRSSAAWPADVEVVDISKRDGILVLNREAL